MNYDFSMLQSSHNRLAKIYWGFYVGALLLFLLATLVSSDAQGNTQVGEGKLGIIILMVVFLPVMSLLGSFVYNVLRQKAINKFIAVNGCASLHVSKGMADLPQALAGAGLTFSINRGFSLPLSADGESLDVFECTGDNGNRNNKSRQYTVAAFQITNVLPHFFLDAKENGTTHSYAGQQKIELEGNFGDYFDVYVPGMANIEAREVLTPEAMQMLIDTGANYDIEINGQLVTVFAPGNLIAKNTLPALIAFSMSLKKELSEERVNWDVVRQVVGTVDRGASATELRRSKYWLWSVVSTVLVAILYAVLQLISASN